MDKHKFDSMINEALSDADLESSEIPSIDLYVDQIVNLVSEKIRQGSPLFYDRHLTKTMINNYSKDGVIAPVRGKKYTKEQIVQILLIYSLKNTLSINEIKRVLTGAYSTTGFDADVLTALYDYYLKIKKENREDCRVSIETFIRDNGLDVADEIDYITLLFSVVSLSTFFKNIAHVLVDAKYPPLTEDEDKKDKEKQTEKNRKKDKDRDKKKEKEEEEKQTSDPKADDIDISDFEEGKASS